MPATRDQDQAIKFYYGNAMLELGDFLPEEDPSVVVEARAIAGHVQTTVERPPVHSRSTESLSDSIQNIENIMESLKTSRKELSYLMADLRRLLGKS